MATKRITIMIDEELDRKLHLKQAEMIRKNRTSYSYSRVINEELQKTLGKTHNAHK